MNVVSRFLKYTAFDTQSDETSTASPSTEKQCRLAEALTEELKELGLSDVHMDEFGYVYALLSASRGMESVPAIGLISHMDTSPDAPGAHVQGRIVHYTEGDLPLNEDGSIFLEKEVLKPYQNSDLIVTDGTTLLGADDKAGIAEIVSAAAFLAEHPSIPHGPVAIAFTPDEEIGRGTAHFNFDAFGAKMAYTVDGGALGELEYENFNAANAAFFFKGFNVHPGSAKNIMRNAILMAHDMVSMMPPAETPAHTEGREGFYHIHRVEGNESHAEVHLLIRDHDRALFERRKERLGEIAAYLSQKYGDGTVKLVIQDSYYNMREKIEPHMELIDRAKNAMLAEGVTPIISPIRGGTDGAQLSHKGLPCPNLCTGGLNYHSVKEFIPVHSLETMVRVLLNLITKP